MTATQQWVKDAKSGGFNIESFGTIEELLMQPLAWQAVGKTRGWSTLYSYHEYKPKNRFETSEVYWTEIEYKQHTFIDHLADGVTIEEALTNLQ